VLVNGEEINQMRAAKLAEFRRTHLGFIFQDFNSYQLLLINLKALFSRFLKDP
jgi:putative ABC transport system ATP-binding protein